MMKIKTKYNIGDKIAVDFEGKSASMTISEINVAKIKGQPAGVSYSGDMLRSCYATVAEDVISGICSRAEATTPDQLANGVYIITKNKSIAPLAEAERDNTALGVVLISDHARIFIAKHEPRDLNWSEATECAAEQSINGEPMRLPDTHEGMEIAFNREAINKAMELIGGDAIKTTRYWTSCEYYSYYAFVFCCDFGYVSSYVKNLTYSVRPVSAFKR